MCEALGMFSVGPLSMPFTVIPPPIPRGHNSVDYLLSTVNTHAHILIVVIFRVATILRTPPIWFPSVGPLFPGLYHGVVDDGKPFVVRG